MTQLVFVGRRHWDPSRQVEIVAGTPVGIGVSLAVEHIEDLERTISGNSVLILKEEESLIFT